MPKKPIDEQLKELDAWLAQGGFSRAKRPQGALERARRQRKEPVQEAKQRRPKSGGEIEVLRADWNWPWLIHGFSTRTGGVSTAFGGRDLNLGGSLDSKKAIAENRRRLLQAIAPATNGQRLATLRQIHSATIHLLDEVPGAPLTGDGLITHIPGLLLGVQVADCVPVLVVDPVSRIVGAFHAGWRGTVKRIVEKGVGMMRMRYGSEPAQMRAAIGPCVGSCCYAVGREVVEEFHSQFDYAKELFHDVFDDDPVRKKYPLLFLTARAPGHSDLGPQVHLDLVESNRRQLISAGLHAENIWTSGLCTSCNTDRLFSHRAEHGKTGRMMGVIGVRAV